MPPEEDKVRGLSPYDFDRLLRAAFTLLSSSFDYGTATGGSQTTLEDTSKNWRTNVWAGALIKITIDSIDYLRLVASNTADTLTFDALPAGIAAASGNKYAVSRVLSISDISAWGGTTLTGRDISLDLAALVETKPAWTHGQKNVTTAGTAVQLPSVSVPNGFQLTIIAKTGNTGYIYLGKSKALAESATDRFDGLSAGLAVSLKITNANLVWVNSSVNGEGVSYLVEQAA